MFRSLKEWYKLNKKIWKDISLAKYHHYVSCWMKIIYLFWNFHYWLFMMECFSNDHNLLRVSRTTIMQLLLLLLQKIKPSVAIYLRKNYDEDAWFCIFPSRTLMETHFKTGLLLCLLWWIKFIDEIEEFLIF